jgi:myo-inositol 2-dehydrogenase/D-chiro-inositol 1-dehydrogenase/scyllo-inositol 2-dehydrogenase (NAD+)
MVHALNFASSVPDAELVAIVDPDPNAASRPARELGVDQVFCDLDQALGGVDFDAVCIGAPTFAHAEIAVKAAREGKHILCEKPMALTLAECDAMIDAAKESGVVLQIGFMRRFDESFVEAKRAVDSGAVGEPVLIKSLTRGPGLPGSWYYSVERSNGLLAEVNSHDFDTVRWFMGEEIASVFSRAGNFKCRELAERYPRLYDYVLVSIGFESSKMGLVEGACPAGYGYDSRLEVVCTEGLVFAGRLNEESVVVCSSGGGVAQPISSSWRRKFKDAYLAEDRHFVECVLGNSPPAVGGEEGRAAVHAVIAANLSITTGRPVRLSEVAAAKTE